MTPNRRRQSAITEEVTAIYDSLVRSVGAREQGHQSAGPSAEGQSVTERLSLPLTLWETGQKPTRTVPALLVYDSHLESEERHDIEPLLVGLDVLVTMLDEFIDTAEADAESRLALATNVAFASLLSFTNLPSDAHSASIDCLLDYFVGAARIPTTEQSVRRTLRTTTDTGRAMTLIQHSYAHRATDISVFGRLPAFVTDIDDSAVARIVHDLETYRAHYLIFDDLRDVEEDRANGTETPVSWLLQTDDDPDVIVDRLAETYGAFEYTDSAYVGTLRQLERAPTDVRVAVKTALNDRVSRQSDASQRLKKH